jgi:hypothetical protein
MKGVTSEIFPERDDAQRLTADPGNKLLRIRHLEGVRRQRIDAGGQPQLPGEER